MNEGSIVVERPLLWPLHELLFWSFKAAIATPPERHAALVALVSHMVENDVCVVEGGECIELVAELAAASWLEKMGHSPTFRPSWLAFATEQALRECQVEGRA